MQILVLLPANRKSPPKIGIGIIGLVGDNTLPDTSGVAQFAALGKFGRIGVKNVGILWCKVGGKCVVTFG
jgi:hypothetical protein